MRRLLLTIKCVDLRGVKKRDGVFFVKLDGQSMGPCLEGCKSPKTVGDRLGRGGDGFHAFWNE